MTALNNSERWITSGNRVSNFTMDETACRCGCGFNDVRQSLIDCLQEIRDYVGVPVKLSCACRCTKHNIAVGGAVASKHLFGEAADIAIADPDTHTDMASDKLFECIKFLDIPCIIKYPGQHFCHIDTRQTTELLRLVKDKTGTFIPV